VGFVDGGQGVLQIRRSGHRHHAGPGHAMREGWRAKSSAAGCRGRTIFLPHSVVVENRAMIEVVSPAMAQKYDDFLDNAQLPTMNDPGSSRLMRATHLTEQA
jgi:hypothetical protein